MTISPPPPIRAIQWSAASEVLRHEERDFTVWLADNLELVADALGLASLTLVERESRVDSFRADIVAVADDGSDDGLPVVIENQYGRTDHAHLGKLITYLAAQQRGLGVWIVEEPGPAHTAAVEFLNRHTSSAVGYALLVVRFAPAPDEGYYVDFDVVTQPNEWVQAGATSAGNSRSGNPERAAFLEQVAERVESPLTDAGWHRVRLVSNRWHIRLELPQTHPWGGRTSYVTLRSKGNEFAFRYIIRAGSYEESRRQLDELRRRHDEELHQQLPKGTEVVWHADADRANAANDQLRVTFPGGGYETADPDEAAAWASQVATVWLRLLNEEP